jgi:hypothetical protein
MENVREMIGIYDAGGNEKLRIPVTLVQLFADVLAPYDLAEKDGHPKASRPSFDSGIQVDGRQRHR